MQKRLNVVNFRLRFIKKPWLQLFFSSGLVDWLKKLASITSPLTYLAVSGTANPLMKMLALLICGIAD